MGKVKPYLNSVVNKTPLSQLNAAFQNASFDNTRNLEGKILTIVDASFADREQREAMKSLIRNALYDNYFPISGIIYQFSQRFNGELIKALEWKDADYRLPTANYFPKE